MVSVKNWQFFDLFISGEKGKAILQKNAFLDYKNKLKRSKN